MSNFAINRLRKIIQREAYEKVKAAAQQFWVICLFGPRQSGKTTLARYSFPEEDTPAFVIYAGDEQIKLAQGTLTSWKKLPKLG